MLCFLVVCLLYACWLILWMQDVFWHSSAHILGDALEAGDGLVESIGNFLQHQGIYWTRFMSRISMLTFSMSTVGTPAHLEFVEVVFSRSPFFLKTNIPPRSKPINTHSPMFEVLDLQFNFHVMVGFQWSCCFWFFNHFSTCWFPSN